MHGAARRITGNKPQMGGGWEMDLSPYEGGHAIGGVQRDPNGRHKEAEYGRAVHCDATDSGTL